MATLKERLDAIANELKVAEAAYAAAVNNQESSTIVNKAKARLNEARKASDLSAPQRSDTTPKAAVPVTATPMVPSTGVATGIATAIPTEVFGEEVTLEEVPGEGEGNAPARYGASSNLGRTVVSTFINPATGDTYALYSDGSRELLFKGTRAADEASAAAGEKLAAEQAATLAAEAKKNEGRSAYSLLFSEFNEYGLGALVEPLKKFIEEGLSPAEFTIRLRETDAYKKRFAANAQRVAKGLRSLSEAEYIRTEDQYQDVMRRYGMPESYYTKGELGIQTGFERFLAGDVSAVEL